MMRSGSIAVTILAIVSSVVPAAAPPATWHDWAAKSSKRMAYSVYNGGKKVGWSIEETKLSTHAGMPVYQSMVEDFTQTLFDGEKNVESERSLTCYELTGEGAIVYYESKRTEDGRQTVRKAERVGTRLRITTMAGNRKVTREVAQPKDTLAQARQLESWLQSPRKRGDRFTTFGIAWDANTLDSKQEYLFRERKKILYQGQSLDVLAVQITIQGSKRESQILPDDRTVTAEIGKFQSIRFDKEELAKKLPATPVELMDLTSVPINIRLGQARNVSMLKLELTGLADFRVPASHRQIFTPGKEKSQIELRRDFCLEKPSELSQADRKRFLRTSPRFQIDQELVITQARKIVGAEKEPLGKAKRIEKWVYRTLKKTYSANADSALEILDTKAGDCTEHSLIFVALCRAAGVPAREVGGLAYVGGKKPSFGWHAWAEIHDGRQWVSIDPTWNQIFVDATHLKMSQGDRDMAWTNVLGTLKMKVLDVKIGE